MIVCVDVDYRDTQSVTACVGIDDWSDAAPRIERVVRAHEPPAPYQAGQFYLRELPRIVDVLATVSGASLVVIDGYVWLATARPGLGARLFDALGGHVPIVGVAKTPFRDNDVAVEVHRGGSTRPVWVTSVGVDVAIAAPAVRRMHGAHRIPTILKRVDRLARDA